jgi:DNA-binding transcriptional LysR family regulator
MGDTLDLVQLRTFVAIADCGGFGRAATALGLSQPTVSQHVRSLERAIDRSLLVKSGRRTRLTPAGERLLVESRRILAVHDEALRRLEHANERAIVVGSTETAADQLLPELLATLRAAYPERPVQFHIDRSTQMSAAVARGSIDLAVLLGFGSDTAGVQIGELPLNWYAAPGWHAPTDDWPWPLVAYVEPCGMRQRALHALGDAGHPVAVAAESTTLEGVLAAARAGLGVAVLPTAGRTPAGLELRDDLPELGKISVRLAARRGLEPEIESTGREALERFFGAVRRASDSSGSPIGTHAATEVDAGDRVRLP